MWCEVLCWCAVGGCGCVLFVWLVGWGGGICFGWFLVWCDEFGGMDFWRLLFVGWRGCVCWGCLCVGRGCVCGRVGVGVGLGLVFVLWFVVWVWLSRGVYLVVFAVGWWVGMFGGICGAGCVFWCVCGVDWGGLGWRFGVVGSMVGFRFRVMVELGLVVAWFGVVGLVAGVDVLGGRGLEVGGCVFCGCWGFGDGLSVC